MPDHVYQLQFKTVFIYWETIVQRADQNVQKSAVKTSNVSILHPLKLSAKDISLIGFDAPTGADCIEASTILPITFTPLSSRWKSGKLSIIPVETPHKQGSPANVLCPFHCSSNPNSILLFVNTKFQARPRVWSAHVATHTLAFDVCYEGIYVCTYLQGSSLMERVMAGGESRSLCWSKLYARWSRRFAIME